MANQETEKFSQRANCYAYAVKVGNPNGVGTPRPGSVTTEEGDTWQTYGERVAGGVLADGGKERVRQLEGGPNPVPQANENHYLIALLANKSGFHFLRRERKKWRGVPRWKWKNGCVDNKVWLNAYSLNAADWITITNDNFGHLVNNLGQYNIGGAGYSDMHFVCFFEVHKNGFDPKTVKCVK